MGGPPGVMRELYPDYERGIKRAAKLKRGGQILILIIFEGWSNVGLELEAENYKN
jgi:hypothetical protein